MQFKIFTVRKRKSIANGRIRHLEQIIRGRVITANELMNKHLQQCYNLFGKFLIAVLLLCLNWSWSF